VQAEFNSGANRTLKFEAGHGAQAPAMVNPIGVHMQEAELASAAKALPGRCCAYLLELSMSTKVYVRTQRGSALHVLQGRNVRNRALCLLG
jgi:hypothetical protein